MKEKFKVKQLVQAFISSQFSLRLIPWFVSPLTSSAYLQLLVATKSYLVATKSCRYAEDLCAGDKNWDTKKKVSASLYLL